MVRLSIVTALSFALACSASPAPAPSPAASAPAAAPVAPAAPVADAPAPVAGEPVTGDPVVARILELGRTDSKVHQWVAHLAKEIGPRLTGSHNLMKAEVWARDTFASFGLEARLEAWGTVPVGFDRGPWSGRMVAPEEVALDFITPSWTPGALGPVRGSALAYPATLAGARKLAKRARGAWIVEPDREEPLPDKLRARIGETLAKAGIAGYIRRARDAKGKLVHTFGQHRVRWDDLPSDVTVYLRGDQHDTITKHLAAGTEVELELSIDNRFFNGPVPQHNVIADIRGTEKPDEYVIIGGHLDSWDGAQGAVDNGTGVATTLEAARLLAAAGVRPKRTIRFMLWGGEEQGLLGSRAYVERNTAIMDKISAVLVHDGGTNYVAALAVTPEMAADAKAIFAPVFDLDPDKPFGLYYAEGMMPGGSDHNPFIAAGVPGFFWEQAGKADYRHAHHTQHDTLEAVVPEYQVHSSMVIAVAAYGLANLDHLLDRTDSSPVTMRPPSGIDIDGTTLVTVKKTSELYPLGFRSGDTILSVNGEATADIMTLARLVFTAQGDKVVYSIRRKGKVQKLVTPNQNKALLAERLARQKRREARYGTLDYRKPFAGRGTRPKSILDRFTGGDDDEKPAAGAQKPAAGSD